jgi:hypothetical protein
MGSILISLNPSQYLMNFPKGEGERKKIKDRSPVPLSGTIKEPHTDIFLLPSQPPLSQVLSNSQSLLSFRKFPRGGGR